MKYKYHRVDISSTFFRWSYCLTACCYVKVRLWVKDKRDQRFCEFLADRGIFPGVSSQLLSRCIARHKVEQERFHECYRRHVEQKVRAKYYYGSSFNGSVELLAYQQCDTATVSRNRLANNPRHVALYGVTVSCLIFSTNSPTKYVVFKLE